MKEIIEEAQLKGKTIKQCRDVCSRMFIVFTDNTYCCFDSITNMENDAYVDIYCTLNIEDLIAVCKNKDDISFLISLL